VDRQLLQSGVHSSTRLKRHAFLPFAIRPGQVIAEQIVSETAALGCQIRRDHAFAPPRHGAVGNRRSTRRVCLSQRWQHTRRCLVVGQLLTHAFQELFTCSVKPVSVQQ